VLLLPWICLAFGLIPGVCILSILVYIYAHRRARTAMALLLAWFALQGVYGEPFGAVLSALDPESRISLMVAATHDAPTSGLMARVERARAQRGDDRVLRFAAGLASARAGQLEASSEHFLAALKADSNDPIATTNLANNHFYLGDIDRAVAGYQRAAQLDPSLGIVYHNLSQAYLRKLFMREGSEAMEQAMRLGFVPSRTKRALPRGSVYYTSPSDRALWALAWQDRAGLKPADLLGAVGLPLGVPAQHAGWWLLATLIVALVAQRSLPRRRLVFECANCEVLSCRSCCGEHDGVVLCLGCAQTAKRARSELVLATLLRNRRHEAELVAQRRLRLWNTWFFGGAHLQSLNRRGVQAAWVLAVGFWLLVAPTLPTDPWTMSMRDDVPIGRWIGGGLLALLWIFCWLGRVPLRTAPLHVHPGSLVSLGDLIEGRPRRRASA
jgi:tetratricopeptide (TPR) repeat protein